MTQLSLDWQPDTGEALKDAGIARVTQSNAEFVRFMREEAKYMARQRGEVHIDDVRERARWYGLKPASPNAWGAIFAERGVWRIIGYRASTVASNHGHVSPVRELITGGE